MRSKSPADKNSDVIYAQGYALVLDPKEVHPPEDYTEAVATFCGKTLTLFVSLPLLLNVVLPCSNNRVKRDIIVKSSLYIAKGPQCNFTVA